MNTGLFASVTRLWLAKVQSIGTPDANEGIGQVLSLSPERVRELIGTAGITDSYTIAAVARAGFLGLI